MQRAESVGLQKKRNMHAQSVLLAQRFSLAPGDFVGAGAFTVPPLGVSVRSERGSHLDPSVPDWV